MGLFNKTIRSNSLQKKESLKPIVLSLNQIVLFEKLPTYLKNNDFENISVSQEFHEIFAIKKGIEYTFMLFTESSHTILSVMVFDEDGIFRKKKLLEKVLNDLRNQFADYLI